MNLGLYLAELDRKERGGFLFEALAFLRPKLRSEIFASLKRDGYKPKNRIAARLWAEGAEVDTFLLWSRSPWKALAGAEVAVLAEALNHDFLGVCEVLDAHPERHQELLALAGLEYQPALWQWIQDRQLTVPFGEPGYQVSWFLANRPLPLEELGPFLHLEHWEQDLQWQIRQLTFLQALALFLHEKFARWELLPKATTDRESVLLHLAKSGRCDSSLLRQACMGEPRSVIQLWETERYPALRHWWTSEGWNAPGLAELLQNKTSQSAPITLLLDALWDPEPVIAQAAMGQLKEHDHHHLAEACQQLKYPYLAIEVLRSTELWNEELENQYPKSENLDLRALLEVAPEQAWKQLCRAPLHHSSQALRRLKSNKYRPLHRPDLFDKMSDLVEAGSLYAVKLNWKSAPLKADWIGRDGQTLFGYSSAEGSFWADKRGDGPRILSPQVIGPLNLLSAYEIDGGYLLRDKSRVLCLNQDGVCRWDIPSSDELLALSPNRNRLALAQGDNLKVIAIHSGEVLVQSSHDTEKPEANNGPVWVVASGPRGRAMDWSEDGRWIATHSMNFTYVWDAETLQVARELKQTTAVTWLGFHKSRLLTTTSSSLGNAMFVGYDTAFYIWDPDSGECLANPSGVSAIGASEVDGSTLLLQGKDSLYTIRLSETVVPDISKAEFLLDARLVGFLHGMALCAHHKGEYYLVDPNRGEVLQRLGSHRNCLLAPGSRGLLSLDHSLRSTSIVDTRVIPELDTSKLTGSAAEYCSLALEVLG